MAKPVQIAVPLKDFTTDIVESGTLAGTVYSHTWLIKGCLAKDQPAILGGPKKALKTTVAIDLAVSLATGKPFLGQFVVPKRSKVLVLSGESGGATIKETAERICVAKGTTLQACRRILWGFSLPSFGDRNALQNLAVFIKKQKVEVVIVDPLYLCLLQGTSMSATNLFDMGSLLFSFTKACLDNGATPILLHHAGKGAVARKTRTGEPLDLEDLAFAGIAEFARQWILLNRRAKYKNGSGKHVLWMCIGGSAGHSSLWGVDVDEGILQDDFTGRHWKVTAIPGEKVAGIELEKISAKRQEKTKKKRKKARKKILEFLATKADGETIAAIAMALKVDKILVKWAIKDLAVAGKLVEVSIEKKAGKGKVKHQGWKIAPSASATPASSPGPVGTSVGTPAQPPSNGQAGSPDAQGQRASQGTPPIPLSSGGAAQAGAGAPLNGPPAAATVSSPAELEDDDEEDDEEDEDEDEDDDDDDE